MTTSTTQIYRVSLSSEEIETLLFLVASHDRNNIKLIKKLKKVQLSILAGIRSSDYALKASKQLEYNQSNKESQESQEFKVPEITYSLEEKESAELLAAEHFINTGEEKRWIEFLNYKAV